MEAEKEKPREETSTTDAADILDQVEWSIMEYVMAWPFICHIASVFLVAWIASLLNFDVFYIFLLGLIYLYQIDKRQREKLHRRIQHEERRNCYRKRLSEGETVRWMNRAVERIWPLFLENFASQMLLLPLSPWFLNAYKPWTAKRAIVQQLCLGKNPPVITMIRTLEDHADGDDLMMEASMEFVASRDMCAVLAVQIRRRLGLGIWTTFHVSNVQLEGKVRIGVKFVNGWPVVGRVRFCFTTPPFLRMTARPLFNFGMDVTELPGIAQWLDRIITYALEQSLVEPNMLVVDVEKLVSKIMFPPPPSQPAQPADWFQIIEKPPVASVLVEILEGADLRAADFNGLSDPFVKGELSPKKFSTKIVWKTLNPKWEESFELPIVSWKLPNTLLLRVRDKDRFREDDLGFCAIPINNYRDGERHEFWQPLEQVKTGKLRLAITVINQDATTNSSNEPTSNVSGFQVELRELKTDDSVGTFTTPTITTEMSPDDSSSKSRPLGATPSQDYSASNDSTESEQALGLTAGSNCQPPGEAKSTADMQSQVSQKSFKSERALSSSAGERVPTTGTADQSTRQQLTTPGLQDQTTTTDERKAVVNIGFGLQPGCISIVELGDAKPAEWPSQKGMIGKGANALLKQEKAADNSPMNTFAMEAKSVGDEAAAAQRLHPTGHVHWGQPEGENTQTKGNVSCQDMSVVSYANESVAIGPKGTVVQVTAEAFDRQPMDNLDKAAAAAVAGFHPRHPPEVLTPQKHPSFSEHMDSETEGGGGDNPEEGHHPSSAQHKRSKAKGLLNMAGNVATHLGQSISRRFKSKKHAEPGSAVTNAQGSFNSTGEEEPTSAAGGGELNVVE